VLQALPAAARAHLLGESFFPGLIAGPFEQGLRIAFSVSAALSVLAALASLLRGKRYIHELEAVSESAGEGERAAAKASG